MKENDNSKTYNRCILPLDRKERIAKKLYTVVFIAIKCIKCFSIFIKYQLRRFCNIFLKITALSTMAVVALLLDVFFKYWLQYF